MVAIAAVIDPTLIATRPAKVGVVTDAGPERGRTVIDFQSAESGAAVEVAVELDVKRFGELLIERISRDVHSRS